MYFHLEESQHVSALPQRTSKQRVAEGWGQGENQIRNWWWDTSGLELCSDKQSSSSGLGVFIPLVANVSCLPWTPISVTSEGQWSGVLTSTMSTPVNNRTSWIWCEVLLTSSSQIAGLRPSGETSPLLVTCRCILKNDSRKNDTDIHKHKNPAQWEVLQKVHNFKNCWTKTRKRNVPRISWLLLWQKGAEDFCGYSWSL